MAQKPSRERSEGIGILRQGLALIAAALSAGWMFWLVGASPYAAPLADAWPDLPSAVPEASMAQRIEGAYFATVAAWFAAFFSALLFKPIAPRRLQYHPCSFREVRKA
jgi:hypothetical protein